MVFAERHQLLLLLLREGVEAGHCLVDGLEDEGQDGVFGVVHFALRDALECQLEDVGLYFGLVGLVGDVDALQHLGHDPRNDLVLVDDLYVFDLLEYTLSPCMHMIFECDLL